jgi:hypothetical protein
MAIFLMVWCSDYLIKCAPSLILAASSDLGYVFGMQDGRMYLLNSIWVNARWPLATCFYATGAEWPVVSRPQVFHSTLIRRRLVSQVSKMRPAGLFQCYNRLTRNGNCTYHSNSAFWPEWVYMFLMNLRINRDYFPEQHQSTALL